MHYSVRRKGRDVIVEQLKARFFRRLTKHSSRLFLKAGDVISVGPQISGEHEPVLSGFIRKCAEDGHGDFLIDIGANIGLISCQTGAYFDVVHMFEPNPLCVQILSVNAAISLDQERFHIHPVGIGTTQSDLTLTVPKNNWGGAFLKNNDNIYTEEMLAQKDGFSSFDSANYFEVTVKIVDGIKKLTELFAELHANGKKSGVIKIDVEGLETPILNAIALTLPDDVKAIIAFENWNKNFDPEPLLSAFGGRARLLIFDRLRPWPDHAGKLRKVLGLLFGGGLSTRLRTWEHPMSITGDLVLDVAPTSRSRSVGPDHNRLDS